MRHINRYLRWDYIKLIPIFVFVVVLPLIVKARIVQIPELEVEWLPSPFTYVDFFNYYKVKLLLVLAVISILFLCIGWVIGKVKYKRNRADIGIVIFALIVCISALTSEHKAIVVYGYPERWHGVVTWISYIIMYFYIRCTVHNHIEKRNVLRLFLISGIVMSFVAFFQFVGMDPFRTDFMKRLILPSGYINKYGLDGIQFTFEKNRVYMTLYNPNNVGLYASALIPICMIGYRVEQQKFLKALWVIVSILSVVAIIGSYSRAGILIAVISLAIYGVYKIDNIRKIKYEILLVVVLLLGAVIIGNHYSGKVLSSRLKDMTVQRQLYTDMEEISINDTELKVLYSGYIFEFPKFLHSKNQPPVNGEGIGYKVAPGGDNYYYFEDENLKNIKYGYGKLSSGQDYLQIIADGSVWRFLIENGNYVYINGYGKKSTITKSESRLFKGNEKLMSNRGYIWSRSIPLILKRPIIGHGPDSYAMVFPQMDYVMVMNVFGNDREIVDKPHNQYIGFLVEYGVLGLLSFLYFVSLSVKNNIKNVLSIPIYSIMLAFTVYDISIGTGWMLFTVIGLLNVES